MKNPFYVKIQILIERNEQKTKKKIAHIRPLKEGVSPVAKKCQKGPSPMAGLWIN